MTESLYATSTRLFEEDAVGSGSPTGEVIEPPLTGAAAARRVLKWESSTSPFRLPTVKVPIHQAYQLRTSHEANPWLVSWLLKKHATLDTGVYYIDREAPDPTFALQIETEDGDLIDFRGMALSELQVSVRERGIVTVECTWAALQRVTGTSLEAVTASYATSLLPSNDCAAVAKAGSLSADARTDVITAYAVELFLRRSDLQIVNYEADGIPGAYTRAPWRALGELLVPWSALADSAASNIDGAFALLLGPDGADLDLRGPEAGFYVQADPIKGDDFRDAQMLFELAGDSRGTLLELRDGL